MIDVFLKRNFLTNIFNKQKYHKTQKEILDFWKNPFSDNTPDKYLIGAKRSKFLLNLVKKYLPLNSDILEIGCNVGRNLFYLYKAGYKKLNGVEINTNAILLMKKKYPELVRMANIYQSSIEDTIKDFSANKFDLVYTMAVLEHIHPDSEWIFSEIARITKSYLITLENESHRHWRSFPRNYKKIFHSLHLYQLDDFSCSKISGLGMTYTARIFKKNQ